jgi:glycosyltransferase involved in cell wall biosynthesis
LNKPFVTIIIPCRNEEAYISICLDSLIENDYPKDKLEILVIDGVSKDDTKKVVLGYKDKFNYIQLYENKDKIFPSAVNQGIKASKGDLILIAGSHAHYNQEYISKCVSNSLKYNADNVGGSLITEAQDKGYIGDIIKTVLSSPFGVGNSTFRTGGNKVREVDTVFGGCYKRDVFERIGFFNENLISTSDYEFNKRLRRNGGKIFLFPDIEVYYYTRSSFKKFLKNNFRNGFWSIYPIAFVDYIPVSLRHLIPLCFILGLLVSVILTMINSAFLYFFLGILLLYFLLAIFFSFKSRDLKVRIVLPAFFFLLHASYGIGSLMAVWKVIYIKIFNNLSKNSP